MSVKITKDKRLIDPLEDKPLAFGKQEKYIKFKKDTSGVSVLITYPFSKWKITQNGQSFCEEGNTVFQLFGFEVSYMYREGNEQITDTLEVLSLNANGEYLIRLSYIPLGNISIRAFKVPAGLAAKKSQAKEYVYAAPHVEDEVDTPNEEDMNTRDIETWGQDDADYYWGMLYEVLAEDAGVADVALVAEGNDGDTKEPDDPEVCKMLRHVMDFLGVKIDSTDATLAELLATVTPFATREAFDRQRDHFVVVCLNQEITENLDERTHQINKSVTRPSTDKGYFRFIKEFVLMMANRGKFDTDDTEVKVKRQAQSD